MTQHYRLLLLPLILQLAACAGFPTLAPSEPEAPAPVAETLPEADAPMQATTDLTGAMLFDILLGEVAGQRNRLDVSVDHYLRAAETAEDPRVAERALRIALFAKQEDAALTAARRWVELAPERLEARQSLAALALHAGIADEAYEQMEFMVAAAREDREAYQTITGLLARSEDPTLALDLMARLTQNHPDSPEAHLAHSRLALHADQTELALSQVERALSLRPDWPDALIMRAGVRVKAGQVDVARSELEAAIAAQPKHVELRLALARLLLDLQDLPAATEQFRQVVKLQPDHVDALYSLGLLAVEEKNYREAESNFRKLLALGQREQEARYYLGRVRELRDDKKDALTWYQRVSEGEYWLEAQIRVAALRAELGDLPTARRQLQTIRSRDPRLAVRLYLVEGDILTHAGQQQEAMNLYNMVLTELPGNHDVLYARALLAEKLNDIPLAESDLRRVVEEDPTNFHAINALGYTLADRTDRFEEALVLIQRALELAPDEAAIIDSMGWVLYRLGRLDEAVQQLRRAYELSDEDPEVGAHLGEVLWQQGKRDEARALWQKARKKSPDNAVLLKTLERFKP